MPTLLSTMLLQVRGSVGINRYGFAGIGGLIGIFVGLIIFIVVVVILYRIFKLLLPFLGLPDPVNQAIYWFVVLLIFLGLLHFFGLY
jgi:hypothetical protein